MTYFLLEELFKSHEIKYFQHIYNMLHFFQANLKILFMILKINAIDSLQKLQLYFLYLLFENNVY